MLVLRNTPLDRDPAETREWVESLDAVFRFAGGERAEFMLSALERKGKRARRAVGRSAVLRLSQHDPAGEAAALSRRSRDREAHHRDHSLERARDGDARQQGLWRARRPRRQLRLGARRSSRSASIISSAAPTPPRAAISCSSSRIRRPASTRAPSSKAGSARTSSNAIARRSAAPASAPIRIPG